MNPATIQLRFPARIEVRVMISGPFDFEKPGASKPPPSARLRRGQEATEDPSLPRRHEHPVGVDPDRLSQSRAVSEGDDVARLPAEVEGVRRYLPRTDTPRADAGNGAALSPGSERRRLETSSRRPPFPACRWRLRIPATGREPELYPMPGRLRELWRRSAPRPLLPPSVPAIQPSNGSCTCRP